MIDLLQPFARSQKEIKPRMRVYSFGIFAPFLFFLGGCNTGVKPLDPNIPSETLWKKGHEYMAKKNYRRGAYFFQNFAQHDPYSPNAPQGYLLAALCAFYVRRYEDALTSLAIIPAFYPSFPYMAQVQYLQGLCYDRQVRPAYNDSENALLALNTFKEVLRRFPSPLYNNFLHQRIEFLQNHLSLHRLYAAYCMMDSSNLVGALTILTRTLPTATPLFRPEYLFRMLECQNALGIELGKEAVFSALQAINPESFFPHHPKLRRNAKKFQKLAKKKFFSEKTMGKDLYKNKKKYINKS